MIKNKLQQKISEYWHLSKTACQYPDNGRWHRMQCVKKWLQEYDKELIESLTPKKLWFAIEDEITVM